MKSGSFLLASHAPRNGATASEVLPRGPKYGQEHGEVLNYPQSVKWATLFRANPVIILLQVSSLTLNNLHYILSDW